MSDSDFAEYYKRISNTELFDILDNAEEYQLSAIQAAKNELNNRNLSPVEIDIAKAPLVLRQLNKETRALKSKEAEDKIKAAGESIFYAVKPFDGLQLVNKSILFIIIVYGLYFVITVTKQFSEIITLITQITESPFLISIFLLPIIMTPIALGAFWKRKTAGWSLLVLCVTFNATGVAIILYKGLFQKISNLWYDNLYRNQVRAGDIFYLFILGSILYVVCKKNIRDVYHIDTPKMAGLILVGAVAGLIFLTF